LSNDHAIDQVGEPADLATFLVTPLVHCKACDLPALARGDGHWVEQLAWSQTFDCDECGRIFNVSIGGAMLGNSELGIVASMEDVP
jgi:hypothetical protein